MTLTSSGLGIGTTPAAAPLDVSGGMISRVATGSWAYATYYNGANIGGIQGNNGILTLQGTTATAPLAIISGNGKVGIGITNPAYALDVGSGTLNAGVTTLSQLTVSGNNGITAYAYYHSSDVRLKTDIHPIGNALDKLLAIKGVQFKWKQDGRADMGVVAQNVAEVFPDVVSKNKDGMMSVEYDSLVGPMIEAIRELKTENDAMRAQISALDEVKAQLTEIRGTLKNLKAENEQLKSIKVDRALVNTHAGSVEQ